MSIKRKSAELSWLQAIDLAEQMQAVLLAPLCVAFVDICGSIRRHASVVHDIDLVVVTETEDHEKVWSALAPLHVKYETQGRVSRRFFWKEAKFDVRLCPNRYRGAMLLTRTGPASLNVAMRAIAKQRHMRLNEYGLWRGNRNLTEGMLEEQIFNLLKLEYLPPPERSPKNLRKLKRAPSERPPNEWRVLSSKGDHYYTVTLTPSGDLSCTCPGFYYRGRCRHVQEILQRKLKRKS